MKNKEFIRINDLAQYLNVSKVTIWRWRKSGQLPSITALSPKIVGWPKETIDKWLEHSTGSIPY
ncbi:helix-turn-helix transcriptional regulator [Vibrio alginolyticus]|uniref:helix-turn-helix transcriptional regulator n=1 Tax=Vibrio harveyi group TaxID=717610 RepID=UPI00215CFAC3|nr:helix-turn-helix domain-containing protein [Vibrio alginolyticus]ELA7326695.1 helix-turn-helix domain-containing protein [Vibrio alginolyticus]MCR9372473.1 helix-turn-helix domain-containing protein [Vibrio alginolyticus]MCR9407576.1 helix-turn-helix domain-containing protein [Vibrio alginolyticus]MCR9454043.1 helix-turn-helix domain-containing protein [Vibrio alginolyticus]MCR9463931.1 helix-turn-helix domain-containing protein [Vibrio alginolyticus]